MTSISKRISSLASAWTRLSSSRNREQTDQNNGLQSRSIWLVMALIGLAISVIEIIDHYSMHVAHGVTGMFIHDRELMREILMFGILLPVAGGILLTLLNRRSKERDRAVKELNLQRVFAEEIHEIANWNELSERIIRFPETILAAAHSFLTVFDLDDQHASLAGSWSAEGAHPAAPPPRVDHPTCRSCLSAKEENAHVVLLCAQSDEAESQQSPERYCLPLTSGDELLAVLNFELTDGQQLTDSKRRLLLSYAPQMASAIENVQLQQSRLNAGEAAAAERQRVAQDLHDTLAQNITFLRLKLDQLSTEDSSLGDFAAVQNEIERMREVADEAYLQVRQSLIELRSDSQADITNALVKLVNSLQARNDIQIQIECHGQPVPLPLLAQRQALNVCREAINNALRHAEATLILVELQWGEADVTLTITDDGRGFSLDAAQHERGYGLYIIHERAATLGGTLAVESIPEQGTNVSLTFPIPEDCSPETPSGLRPVQE